MARLVSFLDRMRVGVTRMQLWPHLVRFLVSEGEKMLNSPPQGMLSSLHGVPHVSRQRLKFQRCMVMLVQQQWGSTEWPQNQGLELCKQVHRTKLNSILRPSRHPCDGGCSLWTVQA